MESVGGGELLLIFVVVLLFFGSKSIPEIAKGMGKATREFRNAMNDVRSEIETSMNVEEKKDTPKQEEIKTAAETETKTEEISHDYKGPERKVFGREDAGKEKEN